MPQININRFHFTFTMTVQSKNTKLKRQFFLLKTTFRLFFIIDQIDNSTFFSLSFTFKDIINKFIQDRLFRLYLKIFYLNFKTRFSSMFINLLTNLHTNESIIGKFQAAWLARLNWPTQTCLPNKYFVYHCCISFMHHVHATWIKIN